MRASRALEGLVYPDFEQAIVTAEWPDPAGGRARRRHRLRLAQSVRGLWGVLDRDDVLWIEGERYLRETPLHEHAAALRQLAACMWYADPGRPHRDRGTAGRAA